MRRYLAAIIFFVALILGILVWMSSIFYVDVPASTKIADFSNKKLTAAFDCPSGKAFQLIFATLPAITIPQNLTFHVTLRDNEEQQLKFTISASELKPCNWLNDSNLQGYILTWSRTPEELLFLSQGKNYNISISASEILPRSTSLWLSYLRKSS